MTRAGSKLESEIIAAFVFDKTATINSVARKLGVPTMTTYDILHRAVDVIGITRARREKVHARMLYLKSRGWTNVRIANETGYSVEGVSGVINRHRKRGQAALEAA